MATLQAKIEELERKLEQQRAAYDSTADSRQPESDDGSENETDEDVSDQSRQSTCRFATL